MFKVNDQINTNKATFVKNQGSKTARNQGDPGNIFVFNNEMATGQLVDRSVDEKTVDTKLQDFNIINNRMSIDTDIHRQ